MTGPTEELAQWAYDFELSSVDRAIWDCVKTLVLDHLGCVIRGGRSAPATSSRHASMLSADLVFASSRELGDGQAAFQNGLASHSIELDDTHISSSLHPGACVLPAALSVGEIVDATGRDLISAAIVGYEAACRIGMAAHPKRLYARGFHPTAVCGVFGAALAAGKLLGLSPDQMADSLGIAASQAAGVMEFIGDGSWTKSLHAGWAAQGGTTAAKLASAGFRGPHMALEGKHGFFHAFAGAKVDELPQLNGKAVVEVALKPHACCRYNQGAIDLAIKFREAALFSVEEIESVEVEIVSAATEIVAEPRERKIKPETVVDAQFSLPYGVSLGLIRGEAFLDEYSLETIQDQELLALARRVICRPSPQLDAFYPEIWPTTMIVQLSDGRRVSRSIDHPRGDPENPLDLGSIAKKFRRLSEGILAEGSIKALSDLVLNIDSFKVRDLVTALLSRVGLSV